MTITERAARRAERKAANEAHTARMAALRAEAKAIRAGVIKRIPRIPRGDAHLVALRRLAALEPRRAHTDAIDCNCAKCDDDRNPLLCVSGCTCQLHKVSK
jgi:hypothetical protein